jgi:hypothetical protein
MVWAPPPCCWLSEQTQTLYQILDQRNVTVISTTMMAALSSLPWGNGAYFSG